MEIGCVNKLTETVGNSLILSTENILSILRLSEEQRPHPSTIPFVNCCVTKVKKSRQMTPKSEHCPEHPSFPKTDNQVSTQ